METEHQQKLLRAALELVESDEATYHIRSALQHIEYNT
jgi:hypothetical protein